MDHVMDFKEERKEKKGLKKRQKDAFERDFIF